MIYFLDSAVNWSEIWVITLVGYSVVFVTLVALLFSFKYILKLIHHFSVKKRTNREGQSVAPKEQYIAGEVNAAIAMGLTLYFNEQHDEESGIITIKRVARTYSPWSSKIYGINNQRS